MKLVYIAGPISSDPLGGTRNAILAAAQLRAMGFGFICPHLSVLMEMVSPQGYASWMELDLELVGRADAVLRLPGESSGADDEVNHAYKIGIPVYRDLRQLADELAEQDEAAA